jgi:hypothetical protein
MNAAFQTRDFWLPYFTLEPGRLHEQDFESQRQTLRADFPLRRQQSKFNFLGKKLRHAHNFVDFEFSCDEHSALRVQYQINANQLEQYLFLVDLSTGRKSELGWSDQARWHPYCLRPEELDVLLRHWSRGDPRWSDPAVPLLLLIKFVGISDQATFGQLKARAHDAWQSLGLGDLLDDTTLPIFNKNQDDGYRWLQDPELGWVFHSEEYPCYSIRNRPHSDGKEGRFPFTEWQKVIAELRAS